MDSERTPLNSIIKKIIHLLHRQKLEKRERPLQTYKLCLFSLMFGPRKQKNKAVKGKLVCIAGDKYKHIIDQKIQQMKNCISIVVMMKQLTKLLVTFSEGRQDFDNGKSNGSLHYGTYAKSSK